MKPVIIFVFILLSLTVCSVSAQEISDWQKHVKSKKLGEFYKERLPTKVQTKPWLIYNNRFENPRTRQIDEVYDPHFMPWLNTAWAIMEMKTGMIPQHDIPKVSEALLEFWKNPDEKYYDLYGMQQYVSDKYSEEIGGNLMIARTRPPMRQQFEVRHELLKTICLLHDFQQVLLETAAKHKKTIMPGYTHIRQAQPTTLGHYLMSIYDPIQRSMDMVEDGYHAMSLNELGSGALAGTSYPIDRKLVSDYLGLEGLIENTNDAVSYTDGYVKVVAGLTNLMTVISRMGLEMEFWSGKEYNFIDFEIGAGSFMMPNKRDNQTYLENTTVGASKLLGNLTEVASMGMRIPHGDMQPMAYNMKSATIHAIGTVNKHFKPFLYHFPGMIVNKEKMLEEVKEGYSCSTELANELDRRFDIDYRTAHEIVHEFVLSSTARNIPASEADINELQKASLSVIGKKIDLSEKELQTILDPINFINKTDSRGGVAPSEVARMISDRWQRLDQARKRQLKRIEKLRQGKNLMMEDLKELNQNLN